MRLGLHLKALKVSFLEVLARPRVDSGGHGKLSLAGLLWLWSSM